MADSTVAALTPLVVPDVFANDIIYVVHDPAGSPADRKIELSVIAYATPQILNPQTTDYTLVISDAGALVSLDSATAITITIPPEGSVAFPIGTRIDGVQLGAGQVEIVNGAGVTTNAYPGLFTLGQYAGFTLVKNGSDSWWAFGALSV